MALLPEIIAGRAAARPDAVAVQCRELGGGCPTDRTLTYGGLWHAATHLARRLRQRLREGARGAEGSRRDVVVVPSFADQGAAVVVAPLAVVLAGAAVCPIDADGPAARVRHMVREAGATVALVHAHDRHRLCQKLRGCSGGGGSSPEGMSGTAAAASCCWCDGDGSGEARAHAHQDDDGACCGITWVVVDDHGGAESGDPPEAPASRDGLPRPAAPEEPCHVVYTSGSTGVPKGAVASHGGMQAFALEHNRVLGVDAASRVFLASAATWDPALGAIFGALAAGATVCVSPRPEVVQDLGPSLRAHGATHVFATPTLWALNATGPTELPALQAVALGGERLPATLLARWADHVRLFNVYGVTEACVWQVTSRCGRASDSAVVGRPHRGTEIQLVPIEGPVDADPDPDPGGRGGSQGRGEIYIGGAQVGLGYLGRPEESRLRFVERRFPGQASTRWFATGDLGAWAADGQLKVLGRMDAQVKLRGFRVELAEVEAVLQREPLVAQAVVRKLGAPERLVAFVQPVEPGLLQDGAEELLLVACRRAMPLYQVPAQLVEVASLPTTASGKVDRKRLEAPPPRRPAPAATTQLTPMERVLARVWGEVLAVEAVGPLDNFWHLGGASVTAIQMLRRLQGELERADDPALARRAFLDSHEHTKVRLCFLHRKPRLRDYASYLDWAALAAPNKSAAAHGNFLALMGEDHPAQIEAGGCTEGRFGPPPAGLATGEGANKTHGHLSAEVHEALPEAADEAAQLGEALGRAAAAGRAGLVERLLALGAPSDGRASRQLETNPPLARAAARGHGAVVQALLRAGAKVNLTNRARATAAHLAAAQGSAACLALLLEAGAAGSARDWNRWTPLHHAAWHGQTGAVAVLCAHDAELDVRDRWGRTALAWAVHNNHIATALALLDAGAEFRARRQGGVPQRAHVNRDQNAWMSTMQLAVRAGLARGADFAMLAALVARGACSPAGTDLDRRTAIHDAVLGAAAAGRHPGPSLNNEGPARALELLLGLPESRALLEAADGQGMTPLALAVAVGSPAAAKQLLAAGAAPPPAPPEGWPAFLARQRLCPPALSDGGPAGEQAWPSMGAPAAHPRPEDRQGGPAAVDDEHSAARLEERQGRALQLVTAARTAAAAAPGPAVEALPQGRDQWEGGNPHSRSACWDYNHGTCARPRCRFGHFCLACGHGHAHRSGGPHCPVAAAGREAGV